MAARSARLLLNVQNASISFGDKVLFEDLSFNICEGDKICLIGKNGSGKSTLMNIITGVRDLDEGTRWQLQGTTIGYLQQDVTPNPNQTIYDYIFEELGNKDGAHDYKIERVVEPLQLNVQDKMSSLSGGQLRRTALARALVEEPDILLLDEPTNHLDLDIITWLETYMKSYRGAILCVSHDKTFLSNISDKVFWLDRGSLRVCPRGFSFFDEWATMILEQEARELHNREKALAQEIDWASRGVPARRKRNMRRVGLIKEERAKLRADKNALNTMLAKITWTPEEVSENTSRSVIEFHNVCKTYQEEGRDPKIILDHFDLRILRGDRIGIVGKNGSGKTSFLKMIVRELTPDMGKVKVAKEINYSYFDQKRKDLRLDKSLHQNLCPHGSDYIDVMGKTRHVCGYLKDFLFDPKMMTQPVSTLSGGQKNRLMLAKILANPGSLLILDEPTNDLDMDTLDMLEEILMNYTGTLLVVSHDRDFLDQTVTKVLAFEGDGKVYANIGGYHDYIEDRAKRLGLDSPDSNQPSKTTQTQKQKAKSAQQESSSRSEKSPARTLSYKLQYELDHLPAHIEKLDKEIAAIEQDLADPELYAKSPDSLPRLSQRLLTLTQEKDQAEHRWLELEDMRESLGS